MQSRSAEMPGFNPMSVPGLSEEARKATKAAFDAMSAWRDDIVDYKEKFDAQVTEKMAEAAKTLGWPQQIVDATRAQMQSITSMQIETIDNLMRVWEEQIKSPNRMAASPAAMLSRLSASPGLGSAGNGPYANVFQMGAFNPLQFWVQCMEQWQKAWTDAMVPPSGKPRRSSAFGVWPGT